MKVLSQKIHYIIAMLRSRIERYCEILIFLKFNLAKYLDLIKKNGCYFRIQESKMVSDQLKNLRHLSTFNFLLPSVTNAVLFLQR